MVSMLSVYVYNYTQYMGFVNSSIKSQTQSNLLLWVQLVVLTDYFLVFFKRAPLGTGLAVNSPIRLPTFT